MCLKLDALYSIFHCFSARLTSQCDVTELSADVSHVSLLFEASGDVQSKHCIQISVTCVELLLCCLFAVFV